MCIKSTTTLLETKIIKLAIAPCTGCNSLGQRFGSKSTPVCSDIKPPLAKKRIEKKSKTAAPKSSQEEILAISTYVHRVDHHTIGH